MRKIIGLMSKIILLGFFPVCMDSLLLVLGAAKRRGSSASWGAHSPTECRLWSCLRASVGRNRCSCPAPTCTPQSRPTNPFLLLWPLAAGLPVPDSLSCPLRGWEQELHLPETFPWGALGLCEGEQRSYQAPNWARWELFWSKLNQEQTVWM